MRKAGVLTKRNGTWWYFFRGSWIDTGKEDVSEAIEVESRATAFAVA